MCQKLIEILKDNEVRISNKGNICLNDFVENIIESKNPDLYIKKLNYKLVTVKNNKYIKPEDCIDLLKKTKFKKCKEIYTKIQLIEGDDSSIIDVENNIFQFEGKRFLSFFVTKEDGEWEVWIKGSEVAKFLEYQNPSVAINHCVEKNNLMKYETLELFLATKYDLVAKNIDKKTIFINLSGFFNLIHNSQKPLAKRIKSWIDNEVMPSLVKFGTYTMQPKKIDIQVFYDDNAISDFFNKNAMYIAYVGIYNGEHLFKFGLTRNIFNRDYKQHRKSFEKFKIVFIGETDNSEKVESLFKQELCVRYLDRQHIIKNKSQTELFTVTTKYTHEYFIDLMKKLIETHKLPAIKEADDKINALTNTIDIYKQSEQIKKLEYKYKKSENYKLKLQRDIQLAQKDIQLAQKDIQIAQIDSDTKIKLKNIDLEIEKEKSKQIAMNKGIKKSSSVFKKRNNSNVITL
ncbi:putative Bro-N domain-containing protein [Moumouvirus australiensis]|uniref:Putative Bro-N domain-containing protein n=1 Tax=Moumouvirus australiensis TaxID=2109587 RepID=A0A2P1EKI4_9VIRU|nr:putative Bro-N domain-containing protein [Moumouvirus australiensis]YP_010789331.1 putative Bro-N domain-containing protein [Moumouvirus australiensis]AVL94396.1 putative Bro-N domain-containing protein [Moumouvirus australiensis]AVL94397.1 putative Bro-N domain-containing protein [Moumouvirus australiensis]